MKTWLTQGLIALFIGICAGLVMCTARAADTFTTVDKTHIFKLSEAMIVAIIRQDEHGNVIAVEWSKDGAAITRYMTGRSATVTEKALWRAEQEIRKIKSECK